MKFEKLNDYKLKIILSNDELPHNSKSLEGFMENPSKARDALIDFIEKAENEVGFHVGDNKVRIDAVTKTDGNYVFTVTKLIPKKKNLKATPHKIPAGTFSNFIIYSFDDFEHFISMCNFLKAQKINNVRNFCKTTELYKYKNKFYLVCSQINNSYKHSAQFYSCVPEFGTFVSCQEIICTMIKEKGELFLKNNAILQCQKTFSEKKNR